MRSSHCHLNMVVLFTKILSSDMKELHVLLPTTSLQTLPLAKAADLSVGLVNTLLRRLNALVDTRQGNKVNGS